MPAASKPAPSPSGTQHSSFLRRPGAIIALHWGTALIGAAVVALILLREQAEGKLLRAWLLEGHRAFGAMVLALTLARLAVRVRHHPLPELVAAATAHRIAIGAMHVALYALLVAVPLLGWVLSSARGQEVSLFGLMALPRLVGRDADLADTLCDAHEWVAWFLIAAVGLHATAALWHHFVRRDPVLLAMLPSRAGGLSEFPSTPSESTEA
jgi:cytochrome b561